MAPQMWRVMRRTAAAVVSGLAGQAMVLAAQAQSGFVKVPDSELAKQESLPAAPLVSIAYAFVFVALLTYVFMLWRRLGRVEQDLQQVTRSVSDRAGRAR
jgi:hypothetical protein